MAGVARIIDRRHTRSERPSCQSLYLENDFLTVATNRNFVRKSAKEAMPEPCEFEVNHEITGGAGMKHYCWK
jgi:hypothetical protein